MGSPLFPDGANIFIKAFETEALDLKPELYLRYVDDNFIIWPHG